MHLRGANPETRAMYLYGLPAQLWVVLGCIALVLGILAVKDVVSFFRSKP